MSNDDNKSKKQQQQHLKILIETAVEEAFLKEDQGVLYKAFIEPFTDVVQTARAGLESSIASVTRNARKVAMQAGAAALPFVAASEVTRLGHDENERLKQKLGEIDAKYGDVLDRNIQALKGKDPAGIAFLMNPALALGAHFGAWAAGKGVGAASGAVSGNLEFLGILTAHVPVVGALFTNLSGKFGTLSQKASDLGTAVVHKPVSSAGFSGGGGGGYGDMGDYGGGFGDGGESADKEDLPMIQEEEASPGGAFTTAELNQKVGQVVQKMLQRKDVQKALASSPVAKAFKTSGVETVVDRANKVASLTTLDQFKQFAGPEFAKFEETLKSQMPEDTSPEALQTFEQEQVVQLKKVYKGIYEKYLKELAGKSQGIGDELKQAQQILNKLS